MQLCMVPWNVLGFQAPPTAPFPASRWAPLANPCAEGCPVSISTVPRAAELSFNTSAPAVGSCVRASALAFSSCFGYHNNRNRVSPKGQDVQSRQISATGERRSGHRQLAVNSVSGGDGGAGEGVGCGGFRWKHPCGAEASRRGPGRHAELRCGAQPPREGTQEAPPKGAGGGCESRLPTLCCSSGTAVCGSCLEGLVGGWWAGWGMGQGAGSQKGLWGAIRKPKLLSRGFSLPVGRAGGFSSLCSLWSNRGEKLAAWWESPQEAGFALSRFLPVHHPAQTHSFLLAWVPLPPSLHRVNPLRLG